MKIILLIAVLSLLAHGCVSDRRCVKSHVEPSMMYNAALKMPTPYNRTVCDEYEIINHNANEANN